MGVRSSIALRITRGFAKVYQTTMQTISVNYTLKWQLNFAQHYKLSKCGKLFNARTGRLIKKVINGGSIGYWIEGNFYTLNELRKHLELIPKNNCPF